MTTLRQRIRIAATHQGPLTLTADDVRQLNLLLHCITATINADPRHLTPSEKNLLTGIRFHLSLIDPIMH